MRARDIKCFLLLFVCYAGRHPYAISTQQFMGHKQQVVQEEERGPQKKRTSHLDRFLWSHH